MSNYIALTRILLKNSMTGFANDKKGSKSRNIKNIVLTAIIVLSLLPLAGAIGAGVWASYPVFKEMGQEGLILGSGLMMISMMVLFFGIFYVMNIFYFSKDVESLLPLPLRPSTIMAAKFTVTMLYEYLTELLFLAPVILAFGIASHAGIIYYLYAILGFLTLPVIPLVYSGIINMVLMRFTNISRNRDRFRIIGGVAAMFLAIFANMKVQSLVTNMQDPELVKAMLTQGNNTLLDAVSGIFPANKLLAIALMNNANIRGLVNILLFLGISALFTALYLTLGESLYFKGLVGISETKSKRKKLTSEQFEKSITKNSAIKAYVIKELRLLFRTPSYFINCVIINFILPVFFIIPFFVNSEGSVQMRELRDLISFGHFEGAMLAIGFAVVLFASGTNGIAATAISREGTNIFVNKYLPVSYHDQIMAKVLTGVALGTVAVLSILVALVFVVIPPAYLIVLILLAGILGVFFTSLTGILIDLNFPKLNWDNEQKAVKQNMNLVVNMLISVIVAAVVVIPTLLLKPNVWLVFAGIVVLFAFVDAVLYGLIKAVGVSLFDKIEA